MDRIHAKIALLEEAKNFVFRAGRLLIELDKLNKHPSDDIYFNLETNHKVDDKFFSEIKLVINDICELNNIHSAISKTYDYLTNAVLANVSPSEEGFSPHDELKKHLPVMYPKRVFISRVRKLALSKLKSFRLLSEYSTFTLDDDYLLHGVMEVALRNSIKINIAKYDFAKT